MSSDRMKPRSGDWAVTIDFLQEVAITSLSSGSSLLKFLRSTTADSPPVRAHPDLVLEFKYCEKFVQRGNTRRFGQPRTDIFVTLQSCCSELDVSIVDRITALLNPQPLCKRNPNKFSGDKHSMCKHPSHKTETHPIARMSNPVEPATDTTLPATTTCHDRLSRRHPNVHAQKTRAKVLQKKRVSSPQCPGCSQVV
uniref:Uncharacterized protein n=1 Tax=Timema monikensis TaxID=170555 RepID=A0A7R9HRK5_9NEOP|nr:unnamed protein product [Timema monikensis]